MFIYVFALIMTSVLFLFDVDGTLSKSRAKAPEKIMKMLKELKKHVNIGFVGGSDLDKQKEQIGENLLDIFTYGFPENGVQYYKGQTLMKSESIISFLGEEKFKNLINMFLDKLSKIDCPVKRGTFIETRNSMINVCPVGRSCSREERNEFFEFDKVNKIRETLVSETKEFTEKMNIVCSIGGQISFDVFPKGWDKTYCLNHIKEETIVFFGDMTSKGGNDYEIYEHSRTIGVTVNGPEDTLTKVKEKFQELGLGELDI